MGLFCLSFLIIFEPITFLIPCESKNSAINDVICYDKHFAGVISGFKQSNGLKGFLLSSWMAISLFMTSLGLWLTIKFLSPLHFLTSDSVITLELNILMDCYYNNKILVKDPLFYIFSLFTVFGCLVYNEIIIINSCNLNYNTRKEIILRQSKDLKYISYELPEYISRRTTGNLNDNLDN